MIGGGIFTTIGTGVKGAGPAVIVSYLLAGLTSFFAALCYAELGAMVPVAGSAYTYAYATMGKLFAWIIGFALIFEYGISAAPVAQQFSAAIQDVVKGSGLVLPAWAQQSNLILHGAWWLPVELGPRAFAVRRRRRALRDRSERLALGRHSRIGDGEQRLRRAEDLGVDRLRHCGRVSRARAPTCTTSIRSVGENSDPFGGLADYSSSAQPYGIIAIGAFVFFSYIGFDTATTTAEECKNPQFDVPVGVIGALAIGTMIYCATAIVLVGAVPWTQVPIKNPLVYALAPLHIPALSWVITIGVLAGTTSVALASLLGQSRIFYVMARDGMLPPAVAAIHPRFKTPFVTTLITGVAVAVLALIVPLNNLLNLVNIGTLVAFSVVCAGVLYLRKRRPDMPRSFRVPFVPLFPILGIVFSLFLAVFGLSRMTWTWFIVAMLCGLVFFFAYGFPKVESGRRRAGRRAGRPRGVRLEQPSGGGAALARVRPLRILLFADVRGASDASYYVRKATAISSGFGAFRPIGLQG